MARESPSAWPRVERLPVARVLRSIGEATGVGLEYLGDCPGGQVGAAYVRLPDATSGVLTWQPGRSLADVEATRAITDVLGAVGYPVPEVLLAVDLGEAIAVVHERLAGQKVDHVEESVVRRLLELNRLQRGALAEHPDVPVVELHLLEDGPGFCLHEPLRRWSRSTAALERWIGEVGTARPSVNGDDAVHYDFHPGNALCQGGVVTGIVDWDGAGRGDCALDLVTLRFGLHSKSAEPGAVAHMDAVLDELPDELLRPFWAHMSLRMVDWAIRHFDPDDVEHWASLARSRMQ